MTQRLLKRDKMRRDAWYILTGQLQDIEIDGVKKLHVLVPLCVRVRMLQPPWIGITRITYLIHACKYSTNS